jgi:hypothetical protein
MSDGEMHAFVIERLVIGERPDRVALAYELRTVSKGTLREACKVVDQVADYAEYAGLTRASES